MDAKIFIPVFSYRYAKTVCFAVLSEKNGKHRMEVFDWGKGFSDRIGISIWSVFLKRNQDPVG